MDFREVAENNVQQATAWLVIFSPEK